MKISKGARLIILGVLLVVIDQIIKVLVKTHMDLGETIDVIGDWFKLHFVLNKGMAFGMAFGGLVGKVLLSLFRIVLIGGLGYYTCNLVRQKAPTGVLIGLALIIAGALGNIIDSAFYGLIFSESTPATIAEFGGSYAPFMMGKVVDMFYFPLFQWENHPQWMAFLFDSRGYFFGPVFNLADAYISVAVVYMLLFQHKFFK